MPSRGLTATTLALTLAASAAGAACGSDLPPELVGRFTRQVQPLLVNRCAAGACHGGPAGHEPRFERGPVSARPDRMHTLANIDTFLKTVGADRVLFATENPGTGSAIDPRSGRAFDDLKPVIESMDLLSDEDRENIFECNCTRLYTRFKNYR